jgi:hypothetical protein
MQPLLHGLLVAEKLHVGRPVIAFKRVNGMELWDGTGAARIAVMLPIPNADPMENCGAKSWAKVFRPKFHKSLAWR